MVKKKKSKLNKLTVFLFQTENEVSKKAAKPHLDPWEGDGATHPGSHFQAYEGQKNH